MGFPGSSDAKWSAQNAGDLGLIIGLGRSPREGNGNPSPVSLPGEFLGQKSLVAYSPWDRKESDMTKQLTTKADIATAILETRNIASPSPLLWHYSPSLHIPHHRLLGYVVLHRVILWPGSWFKPQVSTAHREWLYTGQDWFMSYQCLSTKNSSW